MRKGNCESRLSRTARSLNYRCQRKATFTLVRDQSVIHACSQHAKILMRVGMWRPINGSRW